MTAVNRLLGSLVSGLVSGGAARFAFGGSRPRKVLGLSPAKAMLGLGALGAAFAAYEHYKDRRPSDSAPTPQLPGPTPPRAATPPPLPVPPIGLAPPAPDGTALLLLRAMIAAAYADLEIDAQEREAIVGGLTAGGLDGDEEELLRREMDRPMSIQALAAEATSDDLRRQVYAAALLTIQPDTEAEVRWLAHLASALGLDAAAVAAVEGQLMSQSA